MVNPDGLIGICGDREFMDSFYLYIKLKKELSQSKPAEGTTAMETKQTICEQYLTCIGLCLSQISCNLNHDESYETYLNYLRWNTDIIETEMTDFEGDHCLESYHRIISGMKEDFLSLRQECFTFSISEKGIANEYIQAYNKVCNNQDFRPILVRQEGRLFVNYVNNRAKRCYVDKIDREDVTFAQLCFESIFLIEKLSTIPDADLAKCLSETLGAYTDFRDMDAAARVGQDEQMELAILLAHERATETMLQSAIRTIQESIQDVTAALAIRTKQVWEMSKNPILYPVQTIRNIIHFVSNPLSSAKEVWNWAKENPWKTCAILVGGICLGVVGGITGGILLAPAVGSGILIASVVGGGSLMASAIGGGGLIASALGSWTVGSAIGHVAKYGAITHKIKKETQEEIDKKKEEITRITEQNGEEGRAIALEAIYEEHRREVLKKARELAEEDVRVMRERDEQMAEERRRQIEERDADALRTFESEWSWQANELSQHLIETQEQLGRRRREIQDISVDTRRITEGREAAARVLKRNADRHRTVE